MVRRHAWFLNLDAEDELARPSAGYTPSRATLRRIAIHAALLRGAGGGPSLVRPDDVVVSEGDSALDLNVFHGMAWCPTPRARRVLAKAGALLSEAPDVVVLRAVNHRRFCAALGQTLPGAVLAASREAVREALSGSSPTGKWLLKRPYGYAGRGRILVEPSRRGDLERAAPWIEASLREGDGLQVEPLVERTGDFGLHGYLGREGLLVLGEPTRQTCDSAGAWSGSARAEAGDLAPREREALFEEVHRSAIALREAGYFGPFGVDAFRFEDGRGQTGFHPRCEINARYSMGWAVGMGDRRPDLEGAR